MTTVTVDGSMAGLVIDTNTQTLTDSGDALTVAGTETGIVVIVGIYDSGTTPEAITVKWNTTESLTLIASHDIDPSDAAWQYMFFLAGASTGTLGITVDAQEEVVEITFGATSFNGVNSSTPISTVLKAIALSGNVTFDESPDSSVGDMSVASHYAYDTTSSSPGSGQTIGFETTGNSTTGMGLSYKASGTTSTQMTWQLQSNPSRDKGFMAFTILQAVAGGPAIPLGSHALLGTGL